MKAVIGGVCLCLFTFLLSSTIALAQGEETPPATNPLPERHDIIEAAPEEEPQTPPNQKKRPPAAAPAAVDVAAELKKLDGPKLCETFKKKHEKTRESFRAYNEGLAKLIADKKQPFDTAMWTALDKEFHRLSVKLQDEIIAGLDPAATKKFDCTAETSKQRLVEEIIVMNNDEMLLAYGKEMVKVSNDKATLEAAVRAKAKQQKKEMSDEQVAQEVTRQMKLVAAGRALVRHNDIIKSSWVRSSDGVDFLAATTSGQLDTLRMMLLTSTLIKEILAEDKTEDQKIQKLARVIPLFDAHVGRIGAGINNLVSEADVTLWRKMYLDRAPKQQGQGKP